MKTDPGKFDDVAPCGDATARDAASPSSVPGWFIAALRAYADSQYVKGCYIAHRDECKGSDYKLSKGTFRQPEFAAHKQFNEAMGAHFGIIAAINAALASSTVSGTQKQDQQ